MKVRSITVRSITGKLEDRSIVRGKHGEMIEKTGRYFIAKVYPSWEINRPGHFLYRVNHKPKQ